MPFFKRAKKPDEAAKSPQDGQTSLSAPQPASDPVGEGAEEVAVDKEEQKNRIELARTRTEDIVYPTGFKLAALMASAFISMFLVALVSLRGS